MQADDIRERFRASLERERARYAEEDRRKQHDQLGAYRALLLGLPRRAGGLSKEERIEAAELARDMADLIERGGLN